MAVLASAEFRTSAPTSNILAVQFRGAFDSMAKRFEVVLDPFPEAGGIAVRVTTKNDLTIRVLQIPATVLLECNNDRDHTSAYAGSSG